MQRHRLCVTFGPSLACTFTERASGRNDWTGKRGEHSPGCKRDREEVVGAPCLVPALRTVLLEVRRRRMWRRMHRLCKMRTCGCRRRRRLSWRSRYEHDRDWTRRAPLTQGDGVLRGRAAMCHAGRFASRSKSSGSPTPSEKSSGGQGLARRGGGAGLERGMHQEKAREDGERQERENNPSVGGRRCQRTRGSRRKNAGRPRQRSMNNGPTTLYGRRGGGHTRCRDKSSASRAGDAAEEKRSSGRARGAEGACSSGLSHGGASHHGDAMMLQRD